MPEAVPLIVRLLAPCKTLRIEERAGGIAFRMQGATETAEFSITCLLHHPGAAHDLTIAEQAVAEQLCEGRTLAQIAHLRGVSTEYRQVAGPPDLPQAQRGVARGAGAQAVSVILASKRELHLHILARRSQSRKNDEEHVNHERAAGRVAAALPTPSRE